MTAAASRVVIVNADDLGQSSGVNAGIAAAHEHGVVTSASLMVRWPAAREGAAYGHAHPSLSVGLHVDLGEWVYAGDRWSALYEFDALDDRTQVRGEIMRQLDAFRDLVGRDPTHLDSHQDVHEREPARSLMLALAQQLDIPLRNQTPSVRYCGDFYGQTAEGTPMPAGISVDSLVSLLAELPPGVTELACHPGAADDLDGSMYRIERATEVETLCDRRVRKAIAAGEIELRTFHDANGPWATR